MHVVTSNGPSLSVKPQTRRIGDDMQGKEKKLTVPPKALRHCPICGGLQKRLKRAFAKHNV